MGGIAGRNEESGLLSGCTVRGSVSASRYTGGITGYNLGTLRGCINSASVNTANIDPSLSLDDLNLDAASALTDLVSVGAAESRSATSHRRLSALWLQCRRRCRTQQRPYFRRCEPWRGPRP